MAYTPFVDDRPVLSDTGAQVVDRTRENLMALRDAVVAGTMPGWGMSVSEFSVRAVHSSGVTPSGPSLNTWHSLSSSRLWGVESSSGSVSSILDLTLRHNPTGATWTAQMNLQAQKGLIP